MRPFIAAMVLLWSVALAGQDAGANTGGRKPIFQNSRVAVFRADTPPAAVRSERDRLTVIVGGGKPKSKVRPGAVFFGRAGFPDAVPAGGAAVRAVTVEFASPQGALDKKTGPPSRYCNPGSKTACVDEKYLLCTAKVCVEEVTMGAGAITSKHSHDTDHMIIAVSDYLLADDISGKSVVLRDKKSGEVEYTPAGVTHTLTNKTGKDIHFVVVVFR